MSDKIQSADGSFVIDFERQTIIVDESKASPVLLPHRVEMFPEATDDSECDPWDDPYYAEETAELERRLDE